MKVSIIVPVYNVEKYLPRCIESVLIQTYLNLEIILIDDGSEDNSGKICDSYSEKDNRIKVVHKENGGLSSARNVGVDTATGEAIFFLDSDDYLSKECIFKCVDMLLNYDASVAIIQMIHVTENTNSEIKFQEKELVHYLSSEDAIEESLYQKLYTCCAPAKLYRRNVIGNIRFPIGKVSEDLATCHLFLDRAIKVVYSNYYGYYYRQREKSIMHVFNDKRLDALEWGIEIENFCKRKYPEIIDAAICRTFNVAIHLLLELPLEGKEHDKYFPIIWKELERTRVITIKNRKARMRERIAALLSFLGEKGLRFAWNSKFAIKKKEQQSKEEE